MSEPPDGEILGVRSGRVPSRGASVPTEFGVCHPPTCGCILVHVAQSSTLQRLHRKLHYVGMFEWGGGAQSSNPVIKVGSFGS